ncbi:MAG: hypothetical protein WDZ29_03270 [Balneolaceae bacterium]
MLFERLMKARENGELILIEGGICMYHLRKDRQLTITEIVSTRPGAGSEMLETLKQVKGAESIFAKCPAGLKANDWYKRKGFQLEDVETKYPTQKSDKQGFFESDQISKGKQINHWRLTLKKPITRNTLL